MGIENLRDILAAVPVAREGSFTGAAAYLGVMPLILSNITRHVETGSE
jgi:DNA-binding transcriptional LysR family regulator